MCVFVLRLWKTDLGVDESLGWKLLNDTRMTDHSSASFSRDSERVWTCESG